MVLTFVRKGMLGAMLLAFLLLHALAPAQSPACGEPLRYRSAVFPTAVTPDVSFGNAPAIPLVYVNENVTVAQDLTMDVWLPVNDTVRLRPLILVAFGGGFVVGSKEDADMQALCDTFARKGFVAASINYRKGLNAADDASAERAVYRAAQDWSAVIRWFREYPDSFRVHPDYIFIGGASAGSFAALHSQYMGDANRPASTFAQPFPFTAPDLGCLDCSGNAFGHSSRALALVNLWGAIGDTNWLEAADSVPLISFHGTDDLIVPYGYGFPFTALLTLPRVYGSSLIAARCDHVGLQQQFVSFAGIGHNIWGTVVNNGWAPSSPNARWEPILEDIRDFTWPFLKPVSDPIAGDTLPVLMAPVVYSVPARPGYRWCWEAGPNAVLSPVPNQPHAVSVVWTALGSQTVFATPVNELEAVGDRVELDVEVLAVSAAAPALEAGIRVFPQPGAGTLYIRKDFGEAVDWRLFGMTGDLVEAGHWEGGDLTLEGFAPGAYLLECRTVDRVFVRRLVWGER